MAAQVSTIVPGTTAVSIFRQFWDTQSTAVNGVTAGPHCDDNHDRLNGFPVACHPTAGAQAQGSDVDIEKRMQDYLPVGLVNRFDLARQGWPDCGEYRIVYAKYQGLNPNTGGSADIDLIFEGVLPNPKPGCRSGCVPVARFWAALSSVADPAERAKRLEQFFYTGLPGFRPVVHVDHYGVSAVRSRSGEMVPGGQIRTNYYFLREFKAAIGCVAANCQFAIIPAPVKENPFPLLLDEDIANGTGEWASRAKSFQSTMLPQKNLLAAADLMNITYKVNQQHAAAYATNFPIYSWDMKYIFSFNNAKGAASLFRNSIATAGLTKTQMVNRAYSQSCVGCHDASAFDIGPAKLPDGTSTHTWPPSLKYLTHIEANVSSPPELNNGKFGSGQGHRLSPALLNVFLLARQQALVNLLNSQICVCDSTTDSLGPKLSPAVQSILKSETNAISPSLNALASQIRASASLPQTDIHRQQLEQSAVALFTRFDNELSQKLEQAGVKTAPLAETLAPQPLHLDINITRDPSQQKLPEDLRRTEALIKVITTLQPQPAIDGTFRVH